MIYLDNSAGTRPYPEVIQTITDVLTNHWGNASADYSFGHDAMTIINNVTDQVAEDINCESDEIIWTSGACEANSLAIDGFLKVNPYALLFSTNLEHTSVSNAMNPQTTIKIPNDKYGNIKCDDLENILSNAYPPWNRKLVSISFANSEIGVIQDIKTISTIVHKYNGVLHVDATQMYPWYTIDVQDLGIDMMSVSGQKMHCVKGIGFLYVRNGIELKPLIYGSQQDGRRGGTYPTHLIAAFGKALELTRVSYNVTEAVEGLRNKLLEHLLQIEGAHINGPLINANRLPNNISLTIDNVSASTLTTMCDMMGIAIAKGSACKSYEQKPSDTLLAIGLTPEQALNTIRISLDEFNSLKDVECAANIITKLIERIRNNG